MQRDIMTPLLKGMACRRCKTRALYVRARPKAGPPGFDLGEVFEVTCKACGCFGMTADEISLAVHVYRERGPVA